MGITFRKIWTILKYLSIPIGIIFFYYQTNKHNPCEDSYKKFKNREISGLVQKKYVDSANHLYKTVEVLQKNNLDMVYFNLDKGGSYEYIEQGDSIFKKKKSDILTIIRNTNTRKFKIEYRCKSRN